MPCTCVNTAILMEDENDKLRNIIIRLEKKIKKYKQELYEVYSTSSESSKEREMSYKVIYVSSNPRKSDLYYK